MTENGWPTPAVSAPDTERDRTVLQSALWAAAGDALGWITELSYGEKGVVMRTGTPKVARPVPWKRVIGGRGGPKVNIPAGTYSDDTQLRLAVSRAIRGDGSFDVEAFAKVELTVWPAYALGAGRGSKAAAANLARRSVNWFSNFFDSPQQKYVLSGGNGAAMRIQPHVWASIGNREKLVKDVIRDAVVTHGHPHGFCGAVFHALSLEHAIRQREISTPEIWRAFLDSCLDVIRIIETEAQLSTFWLSEWEARAGVTLKESVLKFYDEGIRDIDLVQGIESGSPLDRYKELLRNLGCLTAEYRGSGWKTALAALALAYFFREAKIENALAASANELESDTDSIGTMAGALLGATANRIPEWPLQDHVYLASEALRLAGVARNEAQDSFSYPDLGYWDPPSKQYTAIGVSCDGMAMAGLGKLRKHGNEYISNGFVWQWCELSFGQNILAKRKLGAECKLAPEQLPVSRTEPSGKTRMLQTKGKEKSFIGGKLSQDDNADGRSLLPSDRRDDRSRLMGETVDSWTDEAIKSRFNDKTLGHMLNRCIDTSRSVESAMGFAAIIAKAKLARMKNQR